MIEEFKNYNEHKKEKVNFHLLYGRNKIRAKESTKLEKNNQRNDGGGGGEEASF